MCICCPLISTVCASRSLQLSEFWLDGWLTIIQRLIAARGDLIGRRGTLNISFPFRTFIATRDSNNDTIDAPPCTYTKHGIYPRSTVATWTRDLYHSRRRPSSRGTTCLLKDDLRLRHQPSSKPVLFASPPKRAFKHAVRPLRSQRGVFSGRRRRPCYHIPHEPQSLALSPRR